MRVNVSRNADDLKIKRSRENDSVNATLLNVTYTLLVSTVRPVGISDGLGYHSAS